MKTIKKVPITPVYVDLMPEELEENTVYISEKYKVSIHLCLCGCKNQSVLSINTNGWALQKNVSEKVSFTPSILNNNCPNRSHYIITNNVANFV